MKTLIPVLIIFNIAFDLSCVAQKSIQTLKSENLRAIPDYSKKNNLKKSKSKVEAHRTYSLNDCSCITPTEYANLLKNEAANFVRSLDGSTYEGTKNGIKMRGYLLRIDITTDNAGIPEDNITALALDGDDNLWIGTANSGIVVGTGELIKPFKTHPINTQELNIFSISHDKKGCIWVTYANGGMECFKNETPVYYFPIE